MLAGTNMIFQVKRAAENNNFSRYFSTKTGWEKNTLNTAAGAAGGGMAQNFSKKRRLIEEKKTS